MSAAQVTLRKLIAHSPAPAEALPVRLRLARLLQSAELAPPGFPPGAVLVIRRLAAPGALSLEALRAGPEWERGVRELLAGLYRRAARVSGGRVPPGADAVLFQDMGEMLACLGLAVRAGTEAGEWPWHPVLGSRSVSSPRTLARTWAEFPGFVPAAVGYLEAWGAAAPVAATLSAEEAEVLFRAVAGAFDLSWEEPGWSAPLKPAAARAAPTGTIPPAMEQDDPVRAAAAPAALSPEMGATGMGASNVRRPPASVQIEGSRASAGWAVPAAPGPDWAGLVLPARRLLGLALVLFHAPRMARRAEFWADLDAWLAQAAQPPSSPTDPGLTAAPGATRTRPESRGAVSPSGCPGSHFEEPDMRPETRERGGASTPDATGSSTGDRAVPSIPAAAGGEDGARPTGTGTPEVAASGAATGVERGGADEPEAVAAGPLWGAAEGIETQVAGVLYLLNLSLRVGLPQCFDAEYRLSEHVTGWGLAEMLGRTLLTPLGETARGDPLWEVLARLDGRQAGEAPGRGFRGGDPYRIPAAWLQCYPPIDGPWRAHSTRRRLTLWHERGRFVIAALRPDQTPAVETAAREIDRYRAQGIDARLRDDAACSLQGFGGGAGPPAPRCLAGWLSSAEGRALPRPLRRWVFRTFPFLLARLRLMLGAEALSDGDLARMLLLLPGRVYVTATHVDMTARMDQIRMPVRRAGLDANPGWVADLMRVVTFHYD